MSEAKSAHDLPVAATGMEERVHEVLIRAASGWLRGAQGCAVVITDMSHAGGETPDAIGWKCRQCLLVECKASRADFLADRQKFFRRRPERGMGDLRWFCTRPGLVRPEELPARWGLLEWDGRRMRQVVKAQGQASDEQQEVSLLVSALRRLGNSGVPGVSVRAYIYESKQRATLGVLAQRSEKAEHGRDARATFLAEDFAI